MATLADMMTNNPGMQLPGYSMPQMSPNDIMLSLNGMQQPQGLPQPSMQPQQAPSIAPGDMSLAGNPQTLSTRIQQWLGASPPDQGGQVQDILSGRFQAQPSANDLGTSALQSFVSGNYVSPQQEANQRITGQLGQLKTVQDLQTGALDMKSKQNIYATQVMSAAAASGDQASYEQGLRFLRQNGIDISGWAPDVATGAQQAQAGRLAQSPLGSLLNAQTKMSANDIAAVQTYGSMEAAIKAGYKPEGISGLGGFSPPSTTAPTTPPATVTPDPAQSAGPPGFGAGPAPKPGMPQFNQTPGQTVTPPASTSAPTQPAAPVFVPPAPIAGESQAAYQDRYKNAMETWKSDPAVIAAQKSADAMGSTQGTALGDAQTAFNTMVNNIPSIVSRTNGIIKYAPAASSGLGVDAQGNGMAPSFDNTSLGGMLNPDASMANMQLQKLTAQGAFPEIAAALKNSNIKGNKFLETLMNNGLGINMQVPGDKKIAAAQGNLSQYIQQVKATAGQLRSMGQANVPSDAQIDAMFTGAGATLPQTYNTPQAGTNPTGLIPAQAEAQGSPSDAIAAELKRRGVQ